MSYLQTINEKLKDLKDAIFPSNSNTSQYDQSNGIISKFSFVLMILIIFIILFQIIANVLFYVYTPSDSPYLVNGMVDGREGAEILQNPTKRNSAYVKRSKNENKGIEFTWSSWLYIDDMNHKEGELRHIFHKGEKNFNVDSYENNKPENQDLSMNYDIMPGMNFPNNSPGVYLAPNTNTIIIYFNTHSSLLEKIEIPNIPMQ